MSASDDLENLRKSFEEVLDDELPNGALATKGDILTREDVEEIAVETLDEFDEEADEDYPWSAREIKDAFDEVLPEDPDTMYPEEKAEFIREHRDDVARALQEKGGSPTRKSAGGRSPEQLSEAIGSIIPDGMTSRLATAEFMRENSQAIAAIADGKDPDDLMEKSASADDGDPDLSNLTKTFLPLAEVPGIKRVDPEIAAKVEAEFENPDVDTPSDQIPALAHFYSE